MIFFQHSWYTREQFEHNVTFAFAYMWFLLGKNYILLSTCPHTSDVYQLPQFTVCYVPSTSTSGVKTFYLFSNNPSSTTSQWLTNCSYFDTHLRKQPFKVKYHLYCNTCEFLYYLECIKTMLSFLLGVYLTCHWWSF